VYAVAYSENDAIYLFSKNMMIQAIQNPTLPRLWLVHKQMKDCPLITGAESAAITMKILKFRWHGQQDQTYLERGVRRNQMKYIFSNTNS
jgi:hypothetical protein